MSQEGEAVEQDLSHIHWSWPEAIAANPARSLATPELAMDYFAYSPFWDSKSNNAVLRTQRRVENPTYGHAEEKLELNAFTGGFEYIIAHSQPPDLFLIHRREVRDGRRDNVSAIYFVLDGKVYPTPRLYDVLATRLMNATHLISKTFSTLSAVHPPSNPRATSQWRSLPPTAKPVRPTNTENPDQDQNMDPADNDQPPQPHDDEKSNEPTKATGPDWHLFHALRSTRRSIASLDEMARSTRPTSIAEGRNEDAGVGGGKKQGKVKSFANLLESAGRVGSTVSGGMTPMVGGQAGRTPSVVGMPGAASPSLSGWAGTPR